MNDRVKKLIAFFALLVGLTLILSLNLIGSTFIWVLLGSITIFVFLLQKSYRRNLLVVSILGLLLGWRGIDFKSAFIIYPTELFVWVGLLIYLTDQILHKKLISDLNWFSALLFLFAMIGVVVSWNYRQSWLSVLNSLKSFLVFLPMMILFRGWIRGKSEILLYAKCLVIVGAVISAIGLLERYVPQIGSLLPSVLSSTAEIRYNFDVGGSIELAAFNFWGTPVISAILALLSGLAAILPSENSGWTKFGWLMMFPVIVLGVIASGYRSAWLGLLPIFLLMLFVNRSQIWTLLIGIVPGSVYLFSSAYVDRFQTILQMIQGSSHDPTFIRRSAALQVSLQSLWNHPLWGVGWNSPTAFNDWVNVGLWTGLPGLLIFMVGYGWLLFSLYRLAQKATERQDRLLLWAFFSALAGYAVVMFSGAMSQVFPLMTAFWFVFCLAWRLVEISSQEKIKNGKIVSPAANF